VSGKPRELQPKEQARESVCTLAISGAGAVCLDGPPACTR